MLKKDTVSKDSGEKEGRIRRWLTGKKSRAAAFVGICAFGGAMVLMSDASEGIRVSNKIDHWKSELRYNFCGQGHEAVLKEVQEEWIRLMKEGKTEQATRVVGFEDAVQRSLNIRRQYPECNDSVSAKGEKR